MREEVFSVQNELIRSPPNNAVYQGFWQSEDYFSDIRETLLDEFKFRDGVLPVSKGVLHEISSAPSVCLNVRRQEYVSLPMFNVTNQDYFLRAAQRLYEQHPGTVFYIFSDDLDWCRKHLSLPYPHVFVGEQHYGDRYVNYMQLMAACQHFIIPNSSYAWWAAWLGEKAGSTIIAPKDWFHAPEMDYSRVVPARWLRLDNLSG